MGSRIDRFEQEAQEAACAREAPTPSFTDEERYQWIRGHRGDPVIDRALSTSNLDADFDRRIDAAIAMSRSGSRQPITISADPGAEPKSRRRGEASSEPPKPIPSRFVAAAVDETQAADDWSQGRMSGGSNWH